LNKLEISPGIENHVLVRSGGTPLQGDIFLPENASGIVIFAHGSGSSRKSPRNRFVAKYLNGYGLGTLLFDLLTQEEERVDEMTYRLRFDIDLLAGRLDGATEWLLEQEEFSDLKIGYFGASTGAAAALITASKNPEKTGAIVSRGGRPDLADPYLDRVEAPTLLIVGGEDFQVIDLNRQAFVRLKSEKKLEIIPGATHLFEEPGALEEVARIAAEWFNTYIGHSPNRGEQT
jgi:dienelactone hydrolase